MIQTVRYFAVCGKINKKEKRSVYVKGDGTSFNGHSNLIDYHLQAFKLNKIKIRMILKLVIFITISKQACSKNMLIPEMSSVCKHCTILPTHRNIVIMDGQFRKHMSIFIKNICYQCPLAHPNVKCGSLCCDFFCFFLS